MLAQQVSHVSLMPGTFYNTSQDDYLEQQLENIQPLHESLTLDKDPHGFVDVFELPCETLQPLHGTWGAVNESSAGPSEFELSGVDWRRYEPPPALREAQIVTSYILRDIVRESIDNVKSQIQQEQSAIKREEEEDAENDAKGTIGARSKGKRPRFSSTETESLASPGSETSLGWSLEPDHAQAISAGQASAFKGSPVITTPDTEKRRPSGFRKLFASFAPEKGESSHTGATHDISQKWRRRPMEALSLVYGKQGVQARTKGSDHDSASKEQKSGKFSYFDTVECASCLDDTPAKTAVKTVCHSYCSECFVRLVEAATNNEQQWPPKCCLSRIPPKTILKNISGELEQTYKERTLEWGIPTNERIYCHKSNCQLWVRPDRINSGLCLARCPKGHWTCTMCRGAEHPSSDCPLDRQMSLTNELAEQEGWKRCSKCNALVEHREACQHMTCRCGNQFCYVCGLRWRTCSCTMQQLQAIKEASDARRRQREQIEQEEAAELQQILAEIEAYEREEQRAIEERRLEVARQEEERLRLEVEARVRSEQAQRRDIRIKYREMRESMALLHDLQQVLMGLSHESRVNALTATSKSDTENLQELQENAVISLESQVEAGVADLESAFKIEYDLRHAADQRLNREYLERLTAFWSAREKGHEQIKIAMIDHAERMLRYKTDWIAWRDSELARNREDLEARRAYNLGKMAEDRQRMDNVLRAGQVELRKKAAAEKLWLQMVVLEREKLLGLREREEMDDLDNDVVDAGVYIAN